MEKSEKSAKLKSKEKVVRTQKPTEFKMWCVKEGLTQRQIKKDAKLSIGTIHAMWYKGSANEANIKLLSLVYKIDEQKLQKMIKKFA